MKKKIWGLVIVIVCCALLAVVGSFVVMVLAPGTEIFGIRYVASGTSKCEELVDFGQVQTDFGSFSDIYVETKNVPININFTDYTSSSVEFCQNFIGLTKSEAKVANLDVHVQNGDLYIIANEIEPYIYSQKADSFYRFNLNLSPYYKSKNIIINSKTSSVTISGNASFSNFTMDSEGELSVPEGSTLSVSGKLDVKTAKIVDMKENVTFSTCNIESTGNSINIANSISGDIIAKTKGGDLKFVSCKNLKFESTSGSVKAYKDNSNIVRGSIEATTNGGSISVSQINGEIIKLETNSGAINIGQMISGEISTSRGKITIDSAKDLVVNSKTGNVRVKNISSTIKVNGKNGKVILGEGGTIANPTVDTTTGEIVVYSATGVVDLYSKSNSVTFENKSSENIKLYSGKKLSAKNLMGQVEAYSKHNGTYVFKEVSGNVSITSGTRADDILIDMTCSPFATVDYSVKSTKSTKAKVYAGENLVAEGSSLESARVQTKYLLKVETSYGAIVLKFANNA